MILSVEIKFLNNFKTVCVYKINVKKKILFSNFPLVGLSFTSARKIWSHCNEISIGGGH